MGRRRGTAARFRPRKATIKLLTGDMLKPINERKAIARAQERNRWLARDRARHLAELRMNSLRNQTERQNARPMVAYYQARVLGDLSISLTNPTIRGRAFEAGSRAHPIVARRFQVLRFRRPGALSWAYRPRVMHKGQQGRFPMRDAMDQLAEKFAENLAEEITKELVRAG